MIHPPLWTVEAMAAAMDCARAGPLPDSVCGISIDSRTIAPGEAFFAIKGESRDGHDFVAAAIKAGAALAVVETRQRSRFGEEIPLLLVQDVLGALGDLARAARDRCKAKIVAVTGSVGKTGTKEALRLALANQGETHASAASYNNHFGVPLSLARCPERARFAIYELGMNHAAEIEPLARQVRPHVVIITAIEPVHLEFFPSIDAIADAKSEIFLGLERGGTAVLNRDNAQFTRVENNARRAGVERIISFGQSGGADAQMLACALDSEGSTVRARVLGIELTYRLGAPGYHVAMNSLAVLAAIELLGADVRTAAAALADLQPPAGRGARLTIDGPRGTFLLIDESYNANPASMRAALAVLGQANGAARRIAVLGDMLELGPAATSLHRELADKIVSEDIDLVFCCGPLMRALWDALPPARRGSYAPTSAELAEHVLAAIEPGDIVMVKGSLGSRMGAIIKAFESRRAPRASLSSELRA
jgi:UDP-N-acetylmuramoyl-tripeptide--D-alanyl-D-alanine ligase